MDSTRQHRRRWKPGFWRGAPVPRYVALISQYFKEYGGGDLGAIQRPSGVCFVGRACDHRCGLSHIWWSETTSKRFDLNDLMNR